MVEKRVLIVEDDQDLLDMLEYNLTKRGYTTLTALDGLHVSDLIERERPDLVLLDIMLPGPSGFEILRTIRNHDQEDISDIPIIMLTALGSPEAKLKGIELGADDYILKPFSVKEVLLKVDRLVSREQKKRQLSDQLRKIETEERQQADFQNMLFHELKTSLCIIGGYSSRIAEKHGLTREVYQHYGGVIKECSVSLSSLAEDMLLLARLENGEAPLPTEDVCIEETMKKLITALSQKAQEKDIAVHLRTMGDLPILRLNPTALKLSLSNLIENALKYSPNKSSIEISLVSEEADRVMVVVEDNGPGIAQEDIKSIFNKFYRGQNVRSSTKGTGIGLYIAKTLIKAMGGKISVESMEGKGTCFQVSLQSADTVPAFRSEATGGPLPGTLSGQTDTDATTTQQ
ncbi:MAG: ATP-binding protein [Thermodesulfobacteriota bacterium]|nr:ATP-binding protein [Thermodesulfobacteriota bacterium]